MVPGCYMTTAVDVGIRDDIHPKKKQPVGQRLARLAMRYVYRLDVEADCPTFDRAEVSEGCLTIAFRHGEGLHTKNKTIQCLSVYVDGKEILGERTLENGKIKVKNPHITSEGAVSVKYAWENWCPVNLYNSAELPVLPFKWDSPKM